MFETETGGGANRVGQVTSITSKNKAWYNLQPSEVVANPVELG